ncbi:MAG TPA: peptidylprolyl isomerase [Polyangiaceae bacterium]|nr:peptidylprolyl isomerase [Polyangiaceae bacterium]
MSTPLIENYVSETPLTLQRPTLRWRRWGREPLLHFMVLGGFLFGLDWVLSRRAEAPNTIHVGAEVDRQAIETFRAARNRAPTNEELEALRRVWLDNEVLYREGLSLQVDKGDPAIRERVIFKTLSIVDSNLKLPRASDELLRAWFEKHRTKYDEPARFDFEEAALSGDNTEAAVRGFVAALNAGTPGDAQAGLRVFKARPRANLVDSYGPEFVHALETARPGIWLAMSTREGWRAVRLNASSPERPAVFEAVRGVVLHDWTDATASEQRTAAVRAIAQKYQVKYEAQP